ncbi:ECF subfamily RNA polymerase sigma-24 factor [Nitratireductor aquibiodomus RA22]|uniref:ECF subfamily RNA polymerase sigma-24 factor n=1 Tax=Nitratireductor aquibiodomus RA22 TaxID=1189611 RepID=I5BT40_9HYPH|nr:ECF subfamily RNA polymerase sigma-24 factor [Nitratireductor aquibiodomus RA22]
MAEAPSSQSAEPASSEEPDEPLQIAPLTRGRCKRLERTEREIVSALELPGQELVRRAECADERDPLFLSVESLVFFIRRAIHSSDTKTRDALFRLLFERCRPFFRGKFRGFDRETREDLQGDVMRKVVEDLFAPDDRGDYMQERFWDYLTKKTVDACRTAFRHSGDTESLDSGFSGEGNSEGLTLLEKQADERLSPEQLSMISDGLAKLPPRLRQVFLLRHYVGMKIGADNPADEPEGEVTIARRYGRSGRTIRNWLKEADALLAGFRENENGE